MNILVKHVDPHRIVATLREGVVAAEVTAWGPVKAAENLLAALDAAEQDGYGECFWPEPTGQYWWMLRLVDRRLDVAVMWSSGVGTGWQHVFRAADEMTFLRDRVREELERHGLGGG